MKMRIRGIEDVNRTLRTIAPKEAKNLMRATVQGIATGVAKDAKAIAPKDSGDVRASIKAKRERGAWNTIRSTVRAGGGGAFYWRFLEYGDGPDNVEHAFFFRALEKFKSEKDQVYLRVFVQKMEARLARLNKAAK